jgi:hypothetical protein
MPANPRVDHQWLEKIRRRERFADFAYTMARVDWGFFTTQTFKNPLPHSYVRGAMFWRWCRDVSEFSGVPYKNLLIALRCEQGEIGGRPHLHALVGGLTSCNMMSVRSRMMRSWKIISGNADADFRLYDRSLAGAEYICKCLSGGANAYEINKFSIAQETTLSDSVISLIRVLDAKSGRRCDELKRKDRQVAKAAGHKTDSQNGHCADGVGGPVSPGLPVVISI